MQLNAIPIFSPPLEANRVVVYHVSDFLVLGHIQHAFEVAPDGDLVCLVGRGLRPQRDPVLLLAHGDHGAADLAGLAKLLADHGEEQVEPALVQVRGLLGLGEEERLSLIHI